jgi:hypothetical protein
MAWTAPATFSTSEVVTATKLNTHIRDNMKELWHEVAYVEFTANVASTTATEVAPLDVVSSGAITYVANPIIIEFGCNGYNANGSSGALNLWDDLTDLGRLHHIHTGTGYPYFRSRRLTPTAASHTYKVRLWTTGGVSSTVYAGAGGVGVELPGYIRVLQKGGA